MKTVSRRSAGRVARELRGHPADLGEPGHEGPRHGGGRRQRPRGRGADQREAVRALVF